MHFYMRGAILSAAILFPPLLHAQFQPPTPEELNLTADPKAPGASAIYLYREDACDEGGRTRSFYERVKVLSEKGKELATVRIPYEHGAMTITGIAARTVHADGTVIPLAAAPADLVDYKTKDFQLDTLVFTLPSVETGSILEYRWTIRYKSEFAPTPIWDVQQPYFVRKAHYSYHPEGFRSPSWTWRTGSDAKVVREKKGLLTLDIADVPPVPDEDWMPPLNTFRWRVEFSYTTINTPDAYWDIAGRGWGEWIKDFIKPTEGIRKIAAGLTAPSDSEETRAVKIYAAVLKLDNTDFSRAKSSAERKKEKIKPIKRAEDVWREQSGSADEIALLYVALAQAAGLKAVPMQIVDRNRALFDKTYLSTSQLDDFIVVATLGGNDVYLDPGQKMCPYGQLHWKHTYSTGLRFAEDASAVIASTPGSPYKAATVDRLADLTLDAQGNVSGSLRFVMTGPEALYWRQLTLENDQDEVKKQFNESMRDSVPEGVQAEFDHFLALEDYSYNLIGIVKVSGSLGAATGKRFFLPGLFFESRARHPFVAQEKRDTPVDVHYARIEQDEVTYHLPPGFDVESAPQATRNNWPDHAFLQIGATAAGASVKVSRTLAYNFALLAAKDYPSLHDFYQKVATADQQQLVLARASAAKGN